MSATRKPSPAHRHVAPAYYLARPASWWGAARLRQLQQRVTHGTATDRAYAPAHTDRRPDDVIKRDQTMFLDCPAYRDEDNAVRCGLPAKVRARSTMRSSDGPIESVMIRCPSGHWFNGPIEFLTPESRQKNEPGLATTALTTGQDRIGASRDGRDRNSRPSRPNAAPATYLGRPAWLWITAMRPRRPRAETAHLAPPSLVADRHPAPAAGLQS